MIQLSNTVATTIAKTEHLQLLKSLGFKEFNIHLLDKTISPQRIKQIVSAENIKVTSVHVPFSESDKVLLENIKDNTAFVFAAMTAELLRGKEMIYLVCHTELGKTQVEHPRMLFQLTQDINSFLSCHPHVILGIENTMILNSNTGSVSGSALPEYLDLVGFIRQNSDYPDRICAVLDICHAKSTIYSIKQMTGDWRINLESYFAKAKGICDILHVSNSTGHGYAKSEHGIGYDQSRSDDLLSLNSVIRLYRKYIPDAKFIYEISEKDYNERVELKNTMQAISRLGYDPINLTKKY